MLRLQLCLLASLLFLFAPASDIYVAVNGDDGNSGSVTKPLATLQAALRTARELRRTAPASVKDGIRIIMRTGRYYLNEPVFIRPEDSGTPGSPTLIESLPGELVELSGGHPVTGWQKASENIPGLPEAASGKIWVADIPDSIANLKTFRQLWVDGRKAIRARDRNAETMSRILSWDHARAECWIPTPKPANIHGLNGMEMLIHQWWAVAVLRVKSAQVFGDSTRLRFHEPESKIQNEHPWPAPWISKKTGNSAFYLTNAIQFLDQPREWFFDERARKLYYWPGSDENPASSDFIVPVHETLVRIQGSADHPVANIHFNKISFVHTGWLRPSLQGHVPLQAGMFLLDAYKLKIPGTPDKAGMENQAWIGRQPAAFEISFANGINVKGCRFRHLAATGLDLIKGTQNNLISGCMFNDIGGTGIQAGAFSDPSTETHLPYNPTDQRELCARETISDNLVTDVTNEDWGCVGIGVGYVRDFIIQYNEVSEVSYSGICVGWGWTKTINSMRNNLVYRNKVHHYAKHMYDVGGLYTLSAMPGSVITENYIDHIYKAPYAHDPEHWFYYYLDEGSAYMTIKNNWSPSDKAMRNSNGPGNTWENNGPRVADSVKRNAGVRKEYAAFLKN